jgi:hypothetical protein
LSDENLGNVRRPDPLASLTLLGAGLTAGFSWDPAARYGRELGGHPTSYSFAYCVRRASQNAIMQ